METKELQSVLQTLDSRTLYIGRQIMEINAQISNLSVQAEKYRNMAESILDRAAYEEDANRAASMASQASAYLSRAEYCESSVGGMQSQADGLKGELRDCRSKYEYYMSEGEANLELLKPALEKLKALSGSRYGKSELAQTLEQTRQRLMHNKKLIDGCRQRIQWIDQICGSEGDQPVRHRTLY